MSTGRTVWPGLQSAPMHREVDMLTGQRRPSAFFRALDATDEKLTAHERQAAELAAIHEAFEWAADSGPYLCSCGSTFEFGAEAGIEDYAALNRWLGNHDSCGEDDL